MSTLTPIPIEWQTLHLPLEACPSFDLEKAVCSHGFFMMAPNRWDSSTKTLERPLRLFSDSNHSIPVRISHDIISSTLNVGVPAATLLSPTNKQNQVARMLRISEKDEMDLVKFHSKNTQAEALGFGRIFRSPTLFEDTVKCMLLCNCGWRRSLEMAQALCEFQLEWAKKHRRVGKPISLCGDFPNSRELANVKAKKYLVERCKLGYRAEHIINFANKVERGKIPIMKVRYEQQLEVSVGVVRDSFKGMPGFGDFTCSYVLTCIGFYHSIPVDSETIRHLRMQHAMTRKKCMKAVHAYAHKIYGHYKPFQFLAYWFELWHFYESKFGKLSQLAPSSYGIVTGSNQ